MTTHESKKLEEMYTMIKGIDNLLRGDGDKIGICEQTRINTEAIKIIMKKPYVLTDWIKNIIFMIMFAITMYNIVK